MKKDPVMLVEPKSGGTMKSVSISGSPAIVICIMASEEISREKSLREVLGAIVFLARVDIS